MIKEPKPPREKKVKEPKAPREKKVKEPKPPKEKKVKEPKPPKEKKVREPKPPKEKKVREPKQSGQAGEPKLRRRGRRGKNAVGNVPPEVAAMMMKQPAVTPRPPKEEEAPAAPVTPPLSETVKLQQTSSIPTPGVGSGVSAAPYGLNPSGFGPAGSAYGRNGSYPGQIPYPGQTPLTGYGTAAPGYQQPVNQYGQPDSVYSMPAPLYHPPAEEKSQSIYGIISFSFGIVGILCFGVWFAFFAIVTSVIMAFFGLEETDKARWSSITGLILSGVALLFCAVNLLLQAGPFGTVFSAKKALESKFYGNAYGYQDYDPDAVYEDDEFYYDDYDEDYYYDDGYDDEYDEGFDDYYYEDDGADSELPMMPGPAQSGGQSNSSSSGSGSSSSSSSGSGLMEEPLTPPNTSGSSGASGSSGSNVDNTVDLTDGVLVLPEDSISSQNSNTGSESTAPAAVGYEAIFNEYSQALRTLGSSNLNKFNQAAVNAQTDDTIDLTELSNTYQAQLEDKADEGLNRISDYMDETDGDYDEFEYWYDLLYDVYIEESDKLDEAYFNS